MPAQICHAVFAEEALAASLGEQGRELLQDVGPWLRLAAQGPDLFYHNRISKPSGLMAGSLLHQSGYGSFLKAWIESLPARNERDPQAVRAVILGFTSHAFLDRATHPFIDYHAGWVSPTDPASIRYYRCHAFYERIIDVLILRERRDMGIDEYDFCALLPSGEDWPGAIVETMATALSGSYPRLERQGRLEARIRNAYRDAQRFYRHTNYQNWQDRVSAVKLDLESTHRRRLALFHPDGIPADIDFLNLSEKQWVHPCREKVSSTRSFIHLYEQALARCAEAFRLVWSALEGHGDTAAVEENVGNVSLNTLCEPPGPLRTASPLPLTEILEAGYERIRETLTT